jgi:hypothetical protein
MSQKIFLEALNKSESWRNIGKTTYTEDLSEILFDFGGTTENSTYCVIMGIS